MNGASLTIRLSPSQREALRRKATAMKTKESTWVRLLIERDVGEQMLGEKLHGLRGAIDSHRVPNVRRHPLAGKISDFNRRK